MGGRLADLCKVGAGVAGERRPAGGAPGPGPSPALLIAAWIGRREKQALELMAEMARRSAPGPRDDTIDEHGKPCVLVPHADGGENFEVRPSPIHGHGTFALRAFAAGEAIGHAATVRTEEENRGQPAGGLCVDRTVLGRYVNHASDPSTGLEERKDGLLHLVALRDIARGEEMTCHYGHAIARQLEAYKKKNGGAGHG